MSLRSRILAYWRLAQPHTTGSISMASKVDSFCIADYTHSLVAKMATLCWQCLTGNYGWISHVGRGRLHTGYPDVHVFMQISQWQANRHHS